LVNNATMDPFSDIIGSSITFSVASYVLGGLTDVTPG